MKQVKKSKAAVINVKYKSKEKWLRYYRVAIQRWLHAVHDRSLLGGPGRVVEFDESCFTKKKKYNRGSGGPRQDRWVFGMVERSHNGVRGRCRVWLVPNRLRQTLLPLIENNIHPATKIISDNYSVYHCLGEMGWDHEMVNHSMEFIERHDRSVHTEGIEGTSYILVMLQ